MTYVYFDESGDTGFDFAKQGTSRQFLIAFLIVDSRRPVSALVKKVFLSLPLAARHKSSGVLHARYEKASTVRKLLGGLAAKDVKIATMRLDKRSVLAVANPNELYTSIVISLVNRLYADGLFDDCDHVKLVASRRNTSKSLNESFSENVVNNALDTKFSVDILKPSDDKCLQAVDFVSWAFWQKYAKNDTSFADLIADKVLHEYEMYK